MSNEGNMSRCFFCDKSDGLLLAVSTFNVDSKVRCAYQLSDEILISKLSGGDMVALDAMYHASCLTDLYRRAKDTGCEIQNDTDVLYHGTALAELVNYIEDQRGDDVRPVFKLMELTKMYAERMQQLGANLPTRIHTTRLKERILTYIPDLREFRDGRNIMLAFDDDIGNFLSCHLQSNSDDDAITLANASKIIRREILKMENTMFMDTMFDGNFKTKCQEDSVPKSLVTLIGMLLGGPNILSQSDNIVETQVVLSISQLIRYNCTIRRRGTSANIYHSKNREPPLPIYLGLLIHAKTRKKGLIDKLWELGLCISHDRVMEISTSLANSVSYRYEKENVVCPKSLLKVVFSTSAVDNIDHNPSSTTAMGSLHGTGISIFQQRFENNIGSERENINFEHVASRTKFSPLPDY